MLAFKHSKKDRSGISWLGHLGIITLSMIAAVMALVVSEASGNDFDDYWQALNKLVKQFGPFAGRVKEDLPGNLNPEHANHFAFEGGDTGSVEDTEEHINFANLDGGGGIDIPTGSKASPLFGAQPFTQQMLRFEEFGPVPLGPEGSVVAGDSFPTPPSAEDSPAASPLDSFLTQYITPTQALPSPFPTREANTSDLNPWQSEIESFLGRSLNSPPAEGRPPGEDWAHQRYVEFFPEIYFNTVQAQARTNTGLRDPIQLHHYNSGEFAPGGLYHNTVGPPASFPQFNGTTDGISVRFHPDFPIQDPNALWTWDGTFPPKLVQAR